MIEAAGLLLLEILHEGKSQHDGFDGDDAQHGDGVSDGADGVGSAIKAGVDGAEQARGDGGIGADDFGDLGDGCIDAHKLHEAQGNGGQRGQKAAPLDAIDERPLHGFPTPHGHWPKCTFFLRPDMCTERYRQRDSWTSHLWG